MPPQYQQTATDPKTGKKWGYDGTNWVEIPPEKPTGGVLDVLGGAVKGVTGFLSHQMEAAPEAAAQKREMANLVAAAQGKPAGPGPLVPGMAGSAARVAKGIATPQNVILGGAAAAVPPLAPLIGGAFMAQGAQQALTPQQKGETTPQYAERGLMGFAGMAGGEAAVAGGAPSATKVGAAGLEKAGEMRAEAHAAKSESLFAKMSGTTPKSGEHVQTAIKSGDLPEIERRYKPRTVRDAAVATRDYANQIEESFVKDAIKRHPDGRISGDDIANGLNKLIDEEMLQLSPEQIKTVKNEIARYAGKEIPIQVAFDHLRKLNAEMRSLSKAAPADKAARIEASTKMQTNTVAAAILRQSLYDRMAAFGEDIKPLQERYGALSSTASVLYKNIPRAERIGKGPSFGRMLTTRHNPWYVLAGGGAFGYETGSAAAGVVAAASIPFLQWVFERRGTPDAVISRAFKQAGKTGIPAAPGTTPPTPAGLLPPAPTPAGPSTMETPSGVPWQRGGFGMGTTEERMGRLLGPAPKSATPLGAQVEPIEQVRSGGTERVPGRPADPRTGKARPSEQRAVTQRDPVREMYKGEIREKPPTTKYTRKGEGELAAPKPTPVIKDDTALFHDATAEWQAKNPGKDWQRTPGAISEIARRAQALKVKQSKGQ